jgi:hypothetical protein
MATTHRSDLIEELEKALTDEAYDGGMGALSRDEFSTLVRTLAVTAEAVVRERCLRSLPHQQSRVHLIPGEDADARDQEGRLHDVDDEVAPLRTRVGVIGHQSSRVSGCRSEPFSRYPAAQVREGRDV